MCVPASHICNHITHSNTESILRRLFALPPTSSSIFTACTFFSSFYVNEAHVYRYVTAPLHFYYLITEYPVAIIYLPRYGTKTGALSPALSRLLTSLVYLSFQITPKLRGALTMKISSVLAMIAIMFELMRTVAVTVAAAVLLLLKPMVAMTLTLRKILHI